MDGWHHYNQWSCIEGYCGEAVVTCMECGTDAHCFLFPGDWLRCCVNSGSLEGHMFKHHTVFCCRDCMESFTRRHTVKE
jgi:hypothetical protein